jgi:hypothetical protein
MSTFTNDTGSVSIDFTIQFDLTSTPKLKVTDNSTYDTAQTGVNVYVKIKRPDGIVRSPGEGTVDITGDSGSLPVFEYELPLSANDGQVSQGQYQIEYMLTVGSDPTVSKTKSFIYDFNKIKLTTFQDINEFTPLVKVKDITPSYDVTNYNTTSVSRVFVAQNNVNGSNIADQTTTGITTEDREYSLADTQSKIYDNKYIVDLKVDVTYASTLYSWFSVVSRSVKRDIVKVHKIPTKLELISYFNTLKNLVETYDGYNKSLFDKYKKNYEFVITNFDLLVRRLDAGISDDDNTDIIRDIMGVLRNDVPREHTGNELTSESLQIYSTGISVTWTSLQNVPTYNPFATYEKTFASASTQWDVTHSLNKKPSVTLVDEYDNIVYGAVEYVNLNVIKITFRTLTKGKVYLN